MSGMFGGLDHADDAAGGAGEDGILALEKRRVGEAAARLHEEQALAVVAVGAGVERFADLFDIAAQDRAEIGVDDGGVAAADQLHQGRGAVAGGDLGEAHVGRDLGGAVLVRGGLVAVHEGDGDGADAVIVGLLEGGADGRFVEGFEDLARGVEAFGDFDAALEEHFGELDIEVEDARAILVADAEKVAEALGDQQQRAVALAFEEGVGGDGGAHLDRVDDALGNRFARGEAEEVADALNGGVLVVLGVFRKQLAGFKRAVGAFGNDVGEGAATVDPELPHHRTLRSLFLNAHGAGAGGWI